MYIFQVSVIRANIFDRRLAEFVTAMEMAPKELKVYRFLARKPMTIKQLESHVNVSERMLRTYLKDLMKKRFIKRKVLESRRLKYLYAASPSVVILRYLKSKVVSLERSAM